MSKIDGKFFEVSNSLRSLIFWLAFGIVGFALVTTLHFVNQESYIKFASKAKLAENIQAFFYFAGGLIFIYLGFRQPWAQGKSKFLLLPFLLGVFYLLVCGEEISWGQDFLKYNTPSFLGNNLEGESNIHNMPFLDSEEAIITQDRALHAFVLLYGILIPLAYRFSSKIRGFLNRIYFPVAPLAVLPFFVLGIIYRQAIGLNYPHYTHGEVKELFFATGFFLAALSALWGKNRIES
jgi:hypothetical protein